LHGAALRVLSGPVLAGHVLSRAFYRRGVRAASLAERMSGPMSDAPRVTVALPAPVDRTFDYLAPAERFPDGPPPPGALVAAPFGARTVVGVVWGPGQAAPERTLKPLDHALDQPPLGAGLRGFLQRAADYTLTPIGMMARLATRAPGLDAPEPTRALLSRGPGQPDRMTPARARVLAALEEIGGAPLAPAALAQAAGVSPGVLAGLEACAALVRSLAPRDAPYPAPDPHAPGPALSTAQQTAAASLRAAAGRGGFSTTLLQGVTGAGKTEVYLEAVAETLAQGRQALVLLPEIALTQAFIERIAKRFGAQPAYWHSGAPPAERRRLWRGVALGDARVVVGARSALFLPFADLGLIVVDEEHDTGYKQEDGVVYHARDMAVLRAASEGAAVVLASATPSLESWVNAETGRYDRVLLPERFGPAAPPKVAMVDLRRAAPPRGRWISPPLETAIRERLARGEQALLFLNRRGYAPLTVCRACGHYLECPDCDARLVEHRLRGRMICHQCGRAEPLPKACPACGRDDRLAATGPGVERLSEEVAALFPEADVALLSSDTPGGGEALRAEIARVAEGQADIVIGTQVVAKGHNFPRLTLVGVVDADMGLENADLRAAERTFQLVRQVLGRAGRAELPGQALLQTVAPEHPVMRAIAVGDQDAFLRREAAARRAAGAPPFGRMAAMILSGPDDARVWLAAKALARAAAPLAAAGVRLLGPAPAPIARIRGNWRVRLLTIGPRAAPLQGALRDWIAAAPPPSGVRLTVDVDPYTFL
jgi:primosomal protein N' (replication factor Y)